MNDRDRIAAIQRSAREDGDETRPRWPMIILRTPKGWTSPKGVDGLPAEGRTNHANLHVRGYKEEGSVTTPFDMVVRNDLDRFHLVMDVIDRVPGLGSRAASLRQAMADRRVTARAYAREHGEDPPEITDWTWPA